MNKVKITFIHTLINMYHILLEALLHHPITPLNHVAPDMISGAKEYKHL